MDRHDAKLVYPHEKFHMVLQSSEGIDEFYALDELESKRLKIIQAKFGCRHCFHTIPDSVELNFNRFIWNEECQCFQVDCENKVSVKLNTLEETVVEYVYDNQLYYF